MSKPNPCYLNTYFKYQLAHIFAQIACALLRELSFFTGKGAVCMWEDQNFLGWSKGGPLLFQWAKGGTRIKKLKYHGNRYHCGPISGLLWREPVIKSNSFLVNGASKSAFQISMETNEEFSNFGSTTTLLNPKRSIMPNFIEIGPETAEATMSRYVLFHAKMKVFFISMATVCEFLNSDKFSAAPVPSPSNRAINEVCRPDGRAGRMFPTSEFY